MSGECMNGLGYPSMDVAYYVFLLSLGLLGTTPFYAQGGCAPERCHESGHCHGSDPPAEGGTPYPVPVRYPRPLRSPFGVWRWGPPPPPPAHPMNTFFNMAKPYLGDFAGPLNSAFGMFRGPG